MIIYQKKKKPDGKPFICNSYFGTGNLYLKLFFDSNCYKNFESSGAGDLLMLLNVSSDEKVLPTTYGELRPPLGKHRLKVGLSDRDGFLS